MPTVKLTQTVVKTATCEADKNKTEFTDSSCKGLVLEVRRSGGKTYYVRYTDNRGRHRQHRIGDAMVIQLAKAKQKANELRAQIALGNDPAEEKAIRRQVPTFTAFIEERYIPYIKGYKKAWQADDSYLRNHILPFFNKKYLDEITKHDVIAFHHGLRAKGYAIGTCNRMLILLRYALNLAVRWEIPGMTVNPTKDVPLFENHNHKERYLSQKEAKRLFEAVRQSDNPMLQFIVPMLILTGARKREVLDSKWEDFDIERMQWRIPMSKTGRPRYIPLSDGVITLLKSIPRKPGVPWVFANPKTGLPYVSIFNSWNTARKTARLKDVRMHDLRHSFASFLVNAGRSLYEVQKILGHTQVKTTQRYAHLAQETLLDATNAVAGILSEAMPIGRPVPALPPAA